MYKLHVIQAGIGDCFLLEYGVSETRYMLIDGGPDNNYKDNLKPALLHMQCSRIESVIVSHIDNDHITGILGLLADLKRQDDKEDDEEKDEEDISITIGQLWFNAFNNTIANDAIEKRIANLDTSMDFSGFASGNKLELFARNLGIPINPVIGKLLMAGSVVPGIDQSDISITVVGPTYAQLMELRDKWDKWTEEMEMKISKKGVKSFVTAMSDGSIPNLSSIVLYIESDGKSMLLTGDCRGDHLQEGLKATGLSADGRFHVNILKVPHHGSNRNTNRRFFEEVTADTYIISGAGDRPHSDVLDWIVETAHSAKRNINLVFTNETIASTLMQQKYDKVKYGYTVKVMQKGARILTVLP